MRSARRFAAVYSLSLLLLLVATGSAQETTGGLQGTVKDPTGAVIRGAQVSVTGTSLVGTKEAHTDGSGYYRFANLPPGRYTLTVEAKGFESYKREGLLVEVGRLPSVDVTLKVGASATVVEVTSEAPVIDVTSSHTINNITHDVLKDVPHGYSYQSVIQFAPMARNEPLMGGTSQYFEGGGTGGGSPGNMANGNAYGYSVGGAADSENGYLVEGQSTANIQGGFSHTDVPFDFIQEVQIKSSGIEAEYGGALGGVVNVIMKKGSNAYHGTVFTQFENDALDTSPNAYPRYDPLSNGTAASWGLIDATYQNYQPVKPKTSTVFPGFTLGGPIKKDKVFFFLGFSPELTRYEEFVKYATGTMPFSRNTNTYYTTGRIDASLGNRVRVYGSWLYQLQRQNGENLPDRDSTQGYFNLSTGCFGPNSTRPCASSGVPPSAYAHSQGFVAPNHTTNVGADITLTPHLVSTTRFGYYFENYHDFGFPTGGNIYLWEANGIGATDSNGAPLPADLQQSSGFINTTLDQNYTVRNASKAVQFNQDVAWFKSGWLGTHNFKFGYQLNRLSNDLEQHFNEPEVQVFPGAGSFYEPVSPTGIANCAPFVGLYGACQGQYGYVTISDFGSLGKVTSFNHAFFAQDSWTIGHGVTINGGIRIEREYLPGEGHGSGVLAHPIDFGWGSKIAPRIGAAWDVFRNGKMKVFGSYGQYNDVMKLNLAISSFGGQYWQNCAYALDTPDINSVNPVFNSIGRYCTGDASGTANFANGTPAGLTFLENQNFRLFPTTCSTCNQFEEGVAPGLKPYRQHDSVFGVDYRLTPTLALEVRWDRRRLDHVIEDASLFNADLGSETFVIVNPGQGVDRTFSGFYNFLYGQPDGCTSNCPPERQIAAARSYDGVEFRLTKNAGRHWYGMFSYTYSRLRGNYSGLTSTDIADGGVGGRNSPNNSRSFDEPFFSWNAQGGSSSGLLPTDRPNTFKGYAYYELPWWGKKLVSTFGLFQYFYQGSPNTSFMDVGYQFGGYGLPSFPVDVVDRGKWVDVTQDPSTGAVTVGPARTFRNPWYIQSDFNFQQAYKLSESKNVSFSVTFTNLFNQHSVTAVNEDINTLYTGTQQFVTPAGQNIGAGVPFYTAAMQPYSIASALNVQNSNGAPITINSQYGKPLFYQLPRTIRLGVKFTF
jgi:hypothetical protein